MTVRVVVADDNALFRAGLVTVLGSDPAITVVAEAANGVEAVAVVREHRPDVVLMDIEMPGGDGIDAIREIGTKSRAIVVSMHANEEQKERAKAAGARGFFSKAVPLQTLAAAIRAVARGHDLMGLTDEERDDLLETFREAQLDPGAASLTAREREILQQLALGVSATEELAERLYISQKTVKNHLASIFQKLAVSDRTQAAIEAIRLGIAKPN